VSREIFPSKDFPPPFGRVAKPWGRGPGFSGKSQALGASIKADYSLDIVTLGKVANLYGEELWESYVKYGMGWLNSNNGVPRSCFSNLHSSLLFQIYTRRKFTF
jgi:hypothetical protein